jgi:hypothetical protein
MPAGTTSSDDHLLVRNDNATPFSMDPGQPIIAALVTPGTRHVVGEYSGMVAGTGLGFSVHNGEQVSIPLVVSTDRCDGGVGSTVPPGVYGVRAGIGPNEGRATYLAPEVTITVTSPAHAGSTP